MGHLAKYIFFIFFISSWSFYAQKDSLVTLDIVVLSDVKLAEFSSGVKVNKIADSIVKTSSSFTDLLSFNSLIYFKENGYGMISSPSFRGTNASQTAVVWNGININSQLTGQTDFNNVSAFNFNDINVRSGGGSVQYGSGAIGGSIHLNNSFHFYDHFTNEIVVSYVSYNTLNTSYNLKFGSEKLYVNTGVEYKKSDNDYEYLGYNQNNENGEYDFVGFNFNTGYFLNESLLLKIFHNSSFNNRNLSGTLTFDGKDSYEDKNYKTMLVLDILGNKFSSNINIAHLLEDYKYFPNNQNENDYSSGKVNTFIVKYDASLNLKKSNLLLKGTLEYDGIKGEGSNIGNNNRDVFSAVFLLNHKPTSKINYGVNLRTEITDDYEVPFILSVDSRFQIASFYALKLNASKNYRIPTFNDLYWVPGGNLDLKPESSKQVELGNDFVFKSHHFNLTGFYITSTDMIKWVPGNSGIWLPENINEVENYGIEFQYNSIQKIGISTLNFSSNYGYTSSVNVETGNQLMYVPKHKFTAAISYNYKKISAYYQLLINGSVYTTTDNSSELSSYDVSDIGIGYQLTEKRKFNSKISFTVKNLFNEIYQNVAYRPMPNRNYNLKLIINI